MKATISRRAIFTAEDCMKPLPFICEQVRCLYYNYPVTPFPDLSKSRSQLEENESKSEETRESHRAPPIQLR